MSEQPDKSKWGKDQVFLFWAALIFLMVGVPLVIVVFGIHKLSQVH